MKRKQKRSIWRTLFFTLFFINLSVLLLIGLLLFWPVEESKRIQPKQTVPDEHSEFIVQTTKENLENLVNAYLEKLLENTDHNYRVALDEDVQLLGELPVFSSTVPLSVDLTPLVQDDGNVILKLKSISLGRLDLPNEKMMKYISDYLVMPDWVTVKPKEEEIYVALTDMKLKSNFHVQAETIDIGANQITLKFFMPYESLGITDS